MTADGAGCAPVAAGGGAGDAIAIFGAPDMSRIWARWAMAETWDRLVDEHSAMPRVSVIKMLIPHAAVMIRNLRGEVQVFDISRIPFETRGTIRLSRSVVVG